MSYGTSTTTSGTSPLHKLAGGLIVVLSLIGFFAVLMIASLLGGAATMLVLLITLIQAAIGVGLLIDAVWASPAAKIYYGLSLVINLVTFQLLGLMISIIILVLVFLGDE